MEVKNLFDADVKKDIVNRINRLSADSKPLWGKMNVAQMLAHLQVPIGVAAGTQNPKRTIMGTLLGPIIKQKFYNNTAFTRSLPTDPSFVMIGSERDFETEKQKLVNLVNNFSEASIVNPTHTFFGKLTKEQWSKGTWKHLDHHLQQFGV